jgi:hypothetical protein
MRIVKDDIEFELLDDVSKKGTPIKYIQFTDRNFRLSEEQKATMKAICQGYLFFSRTKSMWGFTDKRQRTLNICNYLKKGIIPKEIKNKEEAKNEYIIKEAIPFKIEDFEIQFVELQGRPFFYHENKNGVIEININLKHWFFEKRDDTEKNLAKKIVLSIVGTELEFTSPLIESYFNKLNSVQENLKYTYGKSK